LSLAGETGACGVGEASGNGASDVAELRDRFALVLADAPTANAKLLSDKPAAHARAHALTARFLEYLGIIPSSGDGLNSAARSLEYALQRTFKAHTALRGHSACCQKVNEANASKGLTIVHGWS
jgi:hypothetical protein